jgi:hypothetical protein
LSHSPSSFQIYDISSDEGYGRVESSTYQSKSIKKTEQNEEGTTEEGLSDSPSSQEEHDDATEEPASSTYNVHAIETSETNIEGTNQKELINQVNCISGEESDTRSAGSTSQSQPPSSTKNASPFYQAKLTETAIQDEPSSSSRKTASSVAGVTDPNTAPLNHAQRNNTPGLSECETQQQKMRTNYSVYSYSDQQDPIVSVKLKLYHEGFHHQTNHIGVHVREDVYHRQDKTRRDTSNLGSKKRSKSQDLGTSHSHSSGRRDNSRRTKNDTTYRVRRDVGGNIRHETSAAASIAFFILVAMLAYYCLIKNSEPEVNKYRYSH